MPYNWLTWLSPMREWLMIKWKLSHMKWWEMTYKYPLHAFREMIVTNIHNHCFLRNSCLFIMTIISPLHLFNSYVYTYVRPFVNIMLAFLPFCVVRFLCISIMECSLSCIPWEAFFGHFLLNIMHSSAWMLVGLFSFTYHILLDTNCYSSIAWIHRH